MTTDPQWSPCEPGTLDSLQQTGSSPMTRRGALAAVVVAAAGGGAWILSGHEPGNISCARVVELAPDYLDGVLAADLSEQIDAHLQACSKCETHLDQMAQQRDQVG